MVGVADQIAIILVRREIRCSVRRGLVDGCFPTPPALQMAFEHVRELKMFVHTQPIQDYSSWCDFLRLSISLSIYIY